MKLPFVAAAGAALLATVSLSGEAAEQSRTLFNTPDFRADRALWTDPAYYRNNTTGQLSGMAIDAPVYDGASGQAAAARIYGSEGTGRAGAANYASPYAFTSAKAHYDAWVAEAKGGTKHTKATIPDWSGVCAGGGNFGGGQSPASDVVKLLTPKYQEYLVQELKANTEGRFWWPSAFCLPGGFFSALGAKEFIVTPERVWTIAEGFVSNQIRWIYTDGSGHTAENLRFPKWHGESVGVWSGDSLIVYTNQIRGWKGGLSEFTDALETVERYRRVGDRIEGEITLYDPAVYVWPVHARLNFTRVTDVRPEMRPLYNSCTDSNGPSTKVYLDADGFLNERLTGEGDYQWDVADKRPWGTWFTESDRRYKAYLARGGKPHGSR